MNRPGVSEEAKRHAREVLEASGYSVDMPEGSTEDEHDVSFSPLDSFSGTLPTPSCSRRELSQGTKLL